MSQFGVLLAIHSYQGRNFESALIQNVCRIRGISYFSTTDVNRTKTISLHLKFVGRVQRMNRTINQHQQPRFSLAINETEMRNSYLMAYRSYVKLPDTDLPSPYLTLNWKCYSTWNVGVHQKTNWTKKIMSPGRVEKWTVSTNASVGRGKTHFAVTREPH